MEKCFYNGKMIFASEVYKDFTFEQQIRKAGRNFELRCCNPECNSKIIYNFGGNIDKKVPYFSHYRKDIHCYYEDYFKRIKRRNNQTKKIINQCFDIIKEKYSDKYLISREDKLVPKHWTDISIKTNTDVFAIEFIYKYQTPKYLADLMDEYNKSGIHVITIVIDCFNKEKFEHDFNHVKRLQLHSGNEILILYDQQQNATYLLKNDNNKYLLNSPSLFVFKTNFDKLDLINNTFYSEDFEQEFERFVNSRKLRAEELKRQ